MEKSITLYTHNICVRYPYQIELPRGNAYKALHVAQFASAFTQVGPGTLLALRSGSLLSTCVHRDALLFRG